MGEGALWSLFFQLPQIAKLLRSALSVMPIEIAHSPKLVAAPKQFSDVHRGRAGSSRAYAAESGIAPGDSRDRESRQSAHLIPAIFTSA
jgi:hypothetical protein